MICTSNDDSFTYVDTIKSGREKFVYFVNLSFYTNTLSSAEINQCIMRTSKTTLDTSLFVSRWQMSMCTYVYIFKGDLIRCT